MPSPDSTGDGHGHLFRRGRTDGPATLRFVLGDLKTHRLCGRDRRSPRIRQRGPQDLGKVLGMITRRKTKRMAHPRSQFLWSDPVRHGFGPFVFPFLAPALDKRAHAAFRTQVV